MTAPQPHALPPAIRARLTREADARRAADWLRAVLAKARAWKAAQSEEKEAA